MATTEKLATPADLNIKPNNLPEGSGQGLKLRWKGWRGKHAEVTPLGSPSDVQYTVETKMLKPHMTYKRGDQVVCTAWCHALNCNLDLEIHGQKLKLHSRKLTSKYVYTSNVAKGVELTWANKGGRKTFNHVLLDDRSMPIARVRAPYWNSAISIEIEWSDHPALQDPAFKEEVSLTGMTLAYALAVVRTMSAVGASA